MTMVNIDINIKNIENSMFSETPGFIRQLQEAKLTLFTFPYWTLTQTPFWEQKRSSPPFSQEIPPTQVQAKKQHSRYLKYRTQEAEIRTKSHGTYNFRRWKLQMPEYLSFSHIFPTQSKQVLEGEIQNYDDFGFLGLRKCTESA